jgi:SAM-dependent methyltransferase
MKYKTDTFSYVGLDALGIDDAKKEHAYEYGPTHAVPLRKLFKALRIQPGKVLVDLGCGKGKVLLIASEFGFKEVRGVEFSPLLCDIASNNCSTYKARTKTNTVFSIHKSDVLDYGIKDDEDVFYLYDPFDAYILKQVLKNILASLQRRKRKIWIIYHDAEFRGMVEEKMNPTTVFDFIFWGKEFVVFEVEQGEIGMRRPAPPSRDALL